MLKKNEFIYKTDITPVAIAIIVVFDVNRIIESKCFNNSICIKFGKEYLPCNYYIKNNYIIFIFFILIIINYIYKIIIIY